MKNNQPQSTSEHVTQESLIPYTPDEGTYVQRTHKDKLFRFIFRDKKKLLQLYNAINQTSYEDVSQLTITTLQNVIYLSYKNDISFLLDWALWLLLPFPQFLVFYNGVEERPEREVLYLSDSYAKPPGMNSDFHT